MRGPSRAIGQQEGHRPGRRRGAAVGVDVQLVRLEILLVAGIRNRPLTFASVAIMLAALALLACYFPACRAVRVDPMVALRCE